MKILILGFAKLKHMPYLNLYLESIDTKNNELHVLYWNRDGQGEKKSEAHNVTYHEFDCLQEDDVPKYKKIFSFIKYRKKALKLMKEIDFDFAIVLHTLPGVLIKSKLKKDFRERFILDYRDYTYEGIGVFRKIVHDLVHASYCTFVSSDAFRKILPEENKIYTTHNLLKDSLGHREKREHPKNVLRLAFWGYIRHEIINKEIIKKLSGDERFELHFYGREQAIAESLKKHVKNENIRNVFFHGEYAPEDRYHFVKNTDIIHNIYSNEESPPAKDAMGNKFYDGIIFYLPQLCMENSFMAEAVKKYGVGFSCDPFKDSFADDIWDFYKNLEWQKFYDNCDRAVSEVIKEYDTGRNIIADAIKNK